MAGITCERPVSQTTTWLTPPWVIEALGPFDLDPCGHPKSETAKRKIVLPECGLSADWKGSVWLNPPYGRGMQAWMEKLAHHGNGIALVFARTDTQWFHRVAAEASALLFLQKRIQFLRPCLTAGMQAAAPSLFMAFGNRCASRLLKSSLAGWRVDQRARIRAHEECA